MSAAKANGKWPSVRIGEVLRMKIDAVPNKPGSVFQMAGVYGFGRGLFAREPLSGENSTYKAFHRLHEDDFVISKPKGWEGALARVPKQFDGWFLSPVFPTFAANPERLCTRFLEWFCRQPTVWWELQRKAQGIGARRESLHPTSFLSLEIPLPPLAEQQRIAEHLDAVAARVARVRTSLTENEADLQRLLQQEFAALIATAPRRRMEEVAPLVRRPVTVEPDREYHGIAARSFGRGTFRKPPLATDDITWQKLFRVEAGDLLISNIKAWEGAIAVVAPDDAGSVGSHRYLTCVPRPGVVTAHFICHYLLTAEGLRQIGNASPGSADRNRTLGMKALMDIAVPVPPLERQQWFDTLCAKAAALRAHHEAHRADLAALHPSLLDRAFNGER